MPFAHHFATLFFIKAPVEFVAGGWTRGGGNGKAAEERRPLNDGAVDVG